MVLDVTHGLQEMSKVYSSCMEDFIFMMMVFR